MATSTGAASGTGGSRDLGIAALRSGDAVSAVAHLRAAVQADASDGQAWGALGVALCQAGHPAEGVQALERAVALYPQQAALQHNLGKALEAAGRKSDALAAYQRAVALDPSHPQAAGAVKRLATPPPPAAPPARTAPTQLGFELPTSGSSTATVTGTQTMTAPPAGSYVPPSGPPSWGAPPTSGAPAWGAAPPPPSGTPSWGGPPPPPRPAGPSTAYLHMGSAQPAPSRKGGSSGLIIGLVVVLLLGVVGVGGIAAAIILPAVAKARDAAARARAGSPGYRPVGGSAPFTPFGGPRSGGDANLNERGGGPTIEDRDNAFTLSLPKGFPRPMGRPEMVMLGMGGMGRAVTYESNGSAGQCFALCRVYPPDNFEVRDFNSMRKIMEESWHVRFTSNHSTQVAGFPAEECRYQSTMRSGIFGGSEGRLRIIMARPRILIVGFEGNEAGDLDKPAVNAYLDSLRITGQVNTAGLSDGVKIPDPPRFNPPSFQPPTFGPSGRVSGAPTAPDTGSGASFTVNGPSDPAMPPSGMPGGPSSPSGFPSAGPSGPSFPTPPGFGPGGPTGGPMGGPMGGPTLPAPPTPPFGPGGPPGFGPR